MVIFEELIVEVKSELKIIPLLSSCAKSVRLTFIDSLDDLMIDDAR